MRKHIVVGVCGAIVLALGVYAQSASALTIADLQAQIQVLVARLAELQKGTPAVSTYVAPTTSAEPAFQHRVCSVLYRNMVRGTQGDDVKSLQEFLKSEGHLSAEATGYFGSATAQAVAKWQASQGVSAVGSFGPMSRERIRVWCGGGGWNNTERFSASPSRGMSPLTVVFDTWLSGFRPANIYYMIDFGDGTNEQAAHCYAPADGCLSPGQNRHVYTRDGTYTATLSKVTDPCPDDGDPTTPRCMAAIQSEVVAKQQIHVGSTACTKEYMPVCASKPIYCITTPCNPIEQTYSNKCMAAADGATVLYEGQCRTVTEDPAKDSTCKAWFDGCNSCSRETPGSPAMCTLRACIAGAMSRPYCTARFDNTTNKPPVVSSLSGPTTLSVNQVGTWNVSASDPENQSLSYSISWGDEYRNLAPQASLGSYDTSFVQQTSFTHSYAYAGTYTVTITVRDAFGHRATASATVKVGDAPVACTMEYNPVCGKKTYYNTCPPDAVCALWASREELKTYSNRCMMNADGAVFQYQGECSAPVSTICTEEYAPVCGTKYESGPQYCNLNSSGGTAGHTGPCRKDYTYSNRCKLNAAGATFVNEGACTGSSWLYATN